MGPLGKQEFWVSLEFYDVVEKRPGVVSGCPCYLTERFFLKLNPIQKKATPRDGKGRERRRRGW